jgi:argonaute-like protein implicated in RNA metabolism and viral defense
MFTYTTLQKSGFRFSPDDPQMVHDDRLRGIIRFGPYRRIAINAPRLAFVFPEGYRDAANSLYLALRNGIGAFKGLPSVFKIPLEKDQVMAITDFTLRNRHDHHECAQHYRDAIQAWIQANKYIPDLFINLHPRSMSWDEDSAYAATKAALLKEGLLSQNVTFDLIQNSTQFEWSVANIALGLFVKLGGIPWAVNRPNAESDIVIGMGRSESRDPQTRERERVIAFTTCLQSNGIYQFANFGRACDADGDYLKELERTLQLTLTRAQALRPQPRTLTLHFPKDFSREERELCQQTVAAAHTSFHQIEFVKITQEDRFFAIDDESPDEVPKRGTCIRLNKTDYLLYTEGSEERQPWANRPPSAVHIRHFTDQPTDLPTRDVVGQVFDLSLSNWRAFNARGFPVSIYYSELISRILRKADLSQIQGDHIADRLWFL